MTQQKLPFDIPWLNDAERDYAFRLTNDLVTLCRQRGHVPNALTVERIRQIILTDAAANRLEARLADQLDQPSQRVSGAQINATTIARHRHARALDDFELAYPEPAPEPAKQEPPKQENRPYGVSNDYRERVAEVMERMAPELDPFEDPVVTTYFMEKERGRKFHYELPKEAYTDIIRKPQIGGPIDPITREPMILMQYRARQAKWDEIRRLKAKEQAEAQEEEEIQTMEEAQPQSEPAPQPQPEPSTTPNPNAPPNTTAQDSSDPSDPPDPVHTVHPPDPSNSSHVSRRSPAKADSPHSSHPCYSFPIPPRTLIREPVAKNPPVPDPRIQRIPSRTQRPLWETKDPS